MSNKTTFYRSLVGFLPTNIQKAPKTTNSFSSIFEKIRPKGVFFVKYSYFLFCHSAWIVSKQIIYLPFVKRKKVFPDTFRVINPINGICFFVLVEPQMLYIFFVHVCYYNTFCLKSCTKSCTLFISY